MSITHNTFFFLQRGFLLQIVSWFFFSLVKVRTIYKYARLKRRFTTAFMLLINAVFNTTSYQEAEKKKSQTITWSVWKIDSDAQYWELWINTHTAAPPDQNQPTTWNHYRIIKCNIPIDGKDQQIINTAFLIVWDLFFYFFPTFNNFDCNFCCVISSDVLKKIFFLQMF